MCHNCDHIGRSPSCVHAGVTLHAVSLFKMIQCDRHLWDYLRWSSVNTTVWSFQVIQCDLPMYIITPDYPVWFSTMWSLQVIQCDHQLCDHSRWSQMIIHSVSTVSCDHPLSLRITAFRIIFVFCYMLICFRVAMYYIQQIYVIILLGYHSLWYIDISVLSWCGLVSVTDQWDNWSPTPVQRQNRMGRQYLGYK